MTSIIRRATVAGALLSACFAAPIAQAVCPGDCDGSGTVTVNELVAGVGIALGNLAVSACPAFDTNDDKMVSVNELVAAVAAALDGCPAESPTVTPTVPIVPSPTPTLANTVPRGTLQPILQYLPAAVLSISGTAPNDVYAVGADSNDTHGPYVIHYDGRTWKRLDTGVTSGALWWISVTPIPPIDGDFYMAGDNGVILQFDPSSGKFTRQATPDTSQLFGVWGTAADNLWAVGTTALDTTQDQTPVLWHFGGKTWTAQDVSGVVPGGTTSLFKVWGRSATDVFAVGVNGVVLHFDGTSWSLLTSDVSYSLFTVHGTDSVLATVGGFLPTGVILPTGVVLEGNKDVSGSFSFVEHAPSGTPQMNGVFVPPSGNAVAVGVGFSVATRDSSGWTLVNDGTSDTQDRDFHGTWVDASDGIWAVGGNLSNLSNGILAYGGPQSVATGRVQ